MSEFKLFVSKHNKTYIVKLINENNFIFDSSFNEEIKYLISDVILNEFEEINYVLTNILDENLNMKINLITYLDCEIIVKIFFSSINNYKSNHKNKYSKTNYKINENKKLVKKIGLVESQKLHAVDKISFEYIKLEQYLRENKSPFSKVELYYKDIEDNYMKLRHKNLFSEFVDEISDFERFTYLERLNNSKLLLTKKNDINIIKYDYSFHSLVEKKISRDIAKAMYHEVDGFSDRELIRLLEQLDIYIKIETIISKDLKQVYNEINIEDMNYNILSKKNHKVQFEKKTKRVKFYKSKKVLKRQNRFKMKRELNNDIY